MIPFAGLLLQVEQKKVQGKAHQVCINPVSDAIVSDEWQEPPDERRREPYGDYFDFEGHRYQRKVGTASEREQSSYGEPGDTDDGCVVAPKGAIEPRLCADLPAMCGSEPVVSDIAVVVSFRLRQ